MNIFGSGCGCGCTSSCDLLWYIILISLISNCGCGCQCGCNNGCGNGCQNGFDDNKCCCGCNIDLCTLMVLLIVFGCGNKCCK